VKLLLDTNVYVEACRSDHARARFRAAFFPLLPVTYLAAVVAYELRVNALDRPTRRLVEEMTHPMERTGRLVAPTFADWLDASEVVTTIEQKDRSWRSKLPTLLNDVLIALSARRIGATVITYNAQNFRLIRRHRTFSLRVLAPSDRHAR
jgi:predicted nucleic acid-binding protein